MRIFCGVMNQMSNDPNRKSRRSQVLMKATLEADGTTFDAKLRNLSEEGALVEGEGLPEEGADVLFRKGELSMPGRVAWKQDGRAGIAFAQNLSREQLLRHIPQPRQKVQPKVGRPGLGAKPLTEEERRYGEQFIWGSPLVPPKR